MNDRIERQKEFFKYLNSIRNLDFDMYGTLIAYGSDCYVNKENPTSQYFNNWITHFSEKNNIKVFVDSRHEQFCQFVNVVPSLYREHYRAIKMYVPLKITHIEEGAKMLFEFLEKNNVSHESKIASTQRVDNIVIRVFDKESADKISSFVNDNEYIQNGLMKPNPFCLNNGGIACVSDNYLSFNGVLSEYLEDYLQHMPSEYELTLESFRNFVSIKKDKYFKSGENLVEFLDSKRGEINGHFKDDISFLVNYEQVTELILTSLDPKSTIRDYNEHLNNLIEEKRTNQKFEKTSHLLEYRRALIYNQKQNLIHKEEEDKKYILEFNLEDSLNITKEEQILRNVIETNYSKRGLYQIENALKMYIDFGETKTFTRDNDSREKISGLSPRLIEKIMKESSKDKEDFIKDYINETMDFALKRDLKNKFLKEAFERTENKYNFEQAAWGLSRYIEHNNPSAITNDDNARTNLTQNVDSKEAKDLMLYELATKEVKVDEKNNLEIVSLYAKHVLNIEEVKYQRAK